MMFSFKKLFPAYVPASTNGKGDLFILRERILQAILLIFAALGLPAVALGSINNLKEGTPYFAVLYVVIYLLIVAMVIFRDLPFAIRGNLTLGLIYLMALSEFFESGQLGEVRMFLIALSTLTAVLFNYKSVIAVIAIGQITIATAGIYVAITPEPIIPALANIRQGTDWITSSSVFLLLTVAISGAISIIIAGLESNLVKQAELARSLAYERDSLESRIQERTRSMSHRLVQLHTASETSKTIGEMGDLEEMLSQVVDLVKERFGLYYVGVFLLDQDGNNAVLQAGTGEPGKRMLADGHQLAVGGSSMIGWSIANHRARIALDVGAEAVRFNNPNLPLTRSEMALPMIVRDEVLGAVTVQSEKANAFDENDIAVLQSIVDSIAIALKKNRIYRETRQSLEEMRSLNREYLQQAWVETIETYGDLHYDYENPLISEPDASTNTIQIPLMLRNEVIGHVSLEMDRPALSSEESAFVDNITTQTAIALENARLLQETERRAVQEQKLNELAARFSRALNIDEILRAAAQELGQLPAVAEVSIQLNPVDGSQKTLSTPTGGDHGKEHA